MQFYEDEKYGRFIHHRVRREKIILHIEAYFGQKKNI